MPASSPGRRVAERPATLWSKMLDRILALLPDPGRSAGRPSDRRPGGRWPGGRWPGGRWLGWLGIALALSGLALLGAALAELGPLWIERVGAVLLATAYAGALTGRLGGRPVRVGAGAALVGTVVVLLDHEVLRTGAAVLTLVCAGTLGVMLTVPAVRSLHAAREVVVALTVAGLGAFAAVGFGPVFDQVRFEYLTLGLGLVAALLFVHSLGAGLHGLGRRGLVVVLVGGLVLAVTLAYTELLRRHGSPGMIEAVFSTVAWIRETFGAVPRPIEVLLGIPALMWGCHMRARRRQGWWVCAFGVAATVPVGHSLMNLDASLAEALLGQAYNVVLGVLVGYAVIRIDLAMTGQRGSRARRAEEAGAVRPEPRRTAPLQ